MFVTFVRSDFIFSLHTASVMAFSVCNGIGGFLVPHLF